jgi:hypothetical protein
MTSEDATAEAPAPVETTDASPPPASPKAETTEPSADDKQKVSAVEGGGTAEGDPDGGAPADSAADSAAEGGVEEGESDEVVLPKEGIIVELDEGPFPPKGCLAVDLNDSALSRYGMKWGDMIGEGFNSYFLDRKVVDDELETNALSSEFYDYTKQLDKFKNDKLLLIKAPKDNELDVSYVWAHSKSQIEKYTQQIEEKTEALRVEQQKAREEAAAAAKAARIAEGGGEDEFVEEDLSQLIMTEYVDKPLIASEYEEFGSSMEVDHMHVTNSRPLLGFYISQERKYFNARCDFSEHEVDKPPYYNHQKNPEPPVEKT